MSAHPISIRIDNRARLLSAVLAATDWPEREQARQRHRAHGHARNTNRWVAQHAGHAAVRTLQELIDGDTSLEAIYATALSLSWPDLQPVTSSRETPPQWPAQLREFLALSDLQTLWGEDDATWQTACEQTEQVLSGVDLAGFFEPFTGPVTRQLVLMPNISYPSDRDIGVQLDGELFCLVPPRIAWGDNEPWPFNEDEAHVLRGAVARYAHLLIAGYLRQNAPSLAPAAATALPVSPAFRQMYPTWGAQIAALFATAAVALFLERAIGASEAHAYTLMESKLNGLDILPDLVDV